MPTPYRLTFTMFDSYVNEKGWWMIDFEVCGTVIKYRILGIASNGWYLLKEVNG